MSLHLALLAGSLFGLGIFCAVRILAPVPPPDLPTALDALENPKTIYQPSLSNKGQPHKWRTQIIASITSHAKIIRWIRIPDKDLRLLGLTVEEFFGKKITLALIGTALPIIWSSLAAFFGWNLAAPIFIGLIAALVLWLIPDIIIRQQAARARNDCRSVIATFFALVAMGRASGRSPIQALDEAANVGHGWIFLRLKETMAQAARKGITPWIALSQLGDDLDVPEITDLADVVASAADGAAIYTTLIKKSSSLRDALKAREHSMANEQSEKLVFPVVLLGLGYLLLLLYPAFIRLITAM